MANIITNPQILKYSVILPTGLNKIFAPYFSIKKYNIKVQSMLYITQITHKKNNYHFLGVPCARRGGEHVGVPLPICPF
jgi:hypothetical protein